MTTPILLSHYALMVMSLCPMEGRGQKNEEIKGTSPDPLPPSRSQKWGGAGYLRLALTHVRSFPDETSSLMGSCLCHMLHNAYLYVSICHKNLREFHHAAYFLHLMNPDLVHVVLFPLR